LEQAVHFNCFQLLQSAGRDGKTNIAAKGITGEGYEGHYFWDSEIFIFPFFLFTHPDIARQFLDYRYSILDQARKRAKEMGCRGALFPWRTINGEEASAYYPAGTAQIHINADIMYALKQYVTVTGDEDFLREKGMEMLIETSRFYLSYGSFVPNRGFVLDCVTGPDEYTAMVNNNAYTNLMVKDELEYLTAHLHPDNLKKYGVNEKEYRLFKKAADEMYLYRQGDLIGQDDSFLSKGKWDFDTTTSDQYPLLLHFHPLTIYRRQVLKQADLVLAMILQGERFTRKEKEINYDYYEPLTTHDSSLSTSAHAILAAELGRIGPAVAFFYRTARADLDDYQHNIADGVHTAAMAGSWLTIVFGFAGLRIKNGQLHFHPLLPRQWKSYRFGLRFNNTELKISVTETGTAYRRIAGDSLTVYDNGERRTV
jgi:alpha,alpha-trehalose phosphorylase